MKSIYNKIVVSGLAGSALLLGLAACTDDHFDIQESSVSGSQTVWKNIEANPELDSLAMILRRTKVMKTELDRGNKQSFAELLDQPQQLTVWAPKNGTYHAKHYLDMLDQADALRESDAITAMRIDYEVANQFARNHIARFNYESVVGNQQVRMMNSKLYNYDASANKFNGITVDAADRAVSSNGVLHVIEGQSRFVDNIYDFIMSGQAEFSKIYEEIHAEDKITFSPGQSTEGTMNENGQMEYVDSVYVNTNDLLTSAGALISNEDSLYVAIVPTNTAWDEGMEKLKSLYRYADTYWYEWSSTAAAPQGTGNFMKKDMPEMDMDSIANANAKNNLVKSMFIAPSRFRNVNIADSAALMDYIMTADSLDCTNGVILYNKNRYEEGDAKKNPMFAGIKPIKASNGYILPLANYTIDPAYSHMSKLDLKAYNTYNVASVNGTREGYDGMLITLTEGTRNETNPAGEPIVGSVDEDRYALFQSNDQDMYIKFRLNGIMSGHYKISIEMLPNCISNQYVQAQNIPDEGEVQKPVFSARIYDDKGNRLAQVSNLKVSQETVELITLWEDFEFETSYNGLPDLYTTFPYLQIEMTRRNQRSGKCDALSISRVLIEPVRE